MKKKILSIVALMTAMCLIAGCSTTGGKKGDSKDKSAEATTEFEDIFGDVPEEPTVDKPGDYVKLGEYKGITVPIRSAKVTDKEVEEAIKENMETEYVTIKDRDTVKADDYLKIRYKCISEGEELEDYQDELDLIPGEGYLDLFTDDVTEQLIGKKVGETVTIETKFIEDLALPEEDLDNEEDLSDLDASGLEDDDYDDPSVGASVEEDGDFSEGADMDPMYEEEIDSDDAALAGKPVTVKIKILAIEKEETKKLTDKYVQDNFNYDTVAEYKKGIRQELEDSKKEEVEAEAIDALLKEIVNKSEQIKDFPKDLVDEEVKFLNSDLEMEMYENSDDPAITMEEYFKKAYPDYATIEDYAKYCLKESCVHALLTEAYEINPTQDQLDQTVKEMAEYYGSEEMVREVTSEEEIMEQTKNSLLVENLKIDNTLKEEK